MTWNTWELTLNSTILTHSTKQIDVKFIDVDSELVDLNHKVASSIFCQVWRSIVNVWAMGWGRARYCAPVHSRFVKNKGINVCGQTIHV